MQNFLIGLNILFKFYLNITTLSQLKQQDLNENNLLTLNYKTYLGYGFEYKVIHKKAFYHKFIGIVSLAIISTDH